MKSNHPSVGLARPAGFDDRIGAARLERSLPVQVADCTSSRQQAIALD
jgi:hypothetical protein